MVSALAYFTWYVLTVCGLGLVFAAAELVRDGLARVDALLSEGIEQP